MGNVGNHKEPRKSIIGGGLGVEYFRATDDQLEADIHDYEYEESKGTIDPVYIDRKGRLYLLFNVPGSENQKYYLDEHGYKLKGKVLVLVRGRKTWITL